MNRHNCRAGKWNGELARTGKHPFDCRANIGTFVRIHRCSNKDCHNMRFSLMKETWKGIHRLIDKTGWFLPEEEEDYHYKENDNE